MSAYKTVFHIATDADAERLRAEGMLEPSSLEAEGFVHCSTTDQVVATTGRYFNADAELVLLELDVSAIADALQWPEVYPGERFPHLHGPVSLGSLVAVHPWGPDDRRRWPA